VATIQLVVFSLDNQEYGIDVSAVSGILRSKKFKIQVLPGMPKEIAGIINLRGQINYIFNLRIKFGLVEKGLSEESKFIMLNVKDLICGWIVDEVTDILKLDDVNLQSAPDFISGCNNHYIKGIGKVDERLIILLDPEKILSAEEVVATLETPGAVS
jgi:purine-binding chemotaxis protein CheW